MAEDGGNKGKQERKEVKGAFMPLVSVVIPAYNCSRTLGKAIDSALAQDIPLEVLVLDDCGAESLAEIIEGYRVNPAVRYVKNERNLGACVSRNIGVEMAKGKYVAFLDADDWWEKGKLQKQLQRIQETGTVLCTTARELVTPDGRLTGRVIPVTEKITYRQMLRGNCISCSAVLLRRETAQEFPMCHEDSHEDYIAWLKILKKYGEACAVNEPLLKYRLSSSGKSGNKLKSAGMTFKVYRYMGFGIVKSVGCFLGYACHGLGKYAGAHLRGLRKGEKNGRS